MMHIQRLVNSVQRSFPGRCCYASPLLPQQQVKCFAAIDSSWEWLKDPKSPQLQRFLELERKYLANQVSKPKFRKVERTLNMELRNRLLREDFSVPECIGKFEYYMRQAPGENFPVYYRRAYDATATSTMKEQVVLNPNTEPLLNHGFQFISSMKISPDASKLLLIVENNNEQCQVVLKDLTTGKVQLLDDIIGIRNVEWSSTPERIFYYTKVDKHGRPFAVYRYNLMTQTQKLIYEEQDKAFFVDVSQTKDECFVLIDCNSKNTSEIYALDGHSIDAQPQVLRLRETGTLYFADHAAGQFYIVTNADGAVNYKIATFALDAADGHLKTFIPEHKDVKIEDVDLFEKYLVLYERVNSVPRIRNTKYVGFHLESIAIMRHIMYDFKCPHPLVPEIVFDYDMQSRKLQVVKETEMTDCSVKQQRDSTTTVAKSSFKPKYFTCQRCYVPSMSSLGVKIPLTLIHRRDITLNGKNPTLLIGYGAYGTNLEADFELEHLSLLERGWVIALAHVRGGGELGLPWYQAGKGMQKRHTFDDYVSCTHYLLDAGFTNPKRLAGKGVSAGGLIMGYVANEYPQLYQALIMKVPFVDILATMQDPTLPLTVHEYDEWGDPNGPKAHEYIRSYAPCENVRENQVYPAMFVTGSLNDQRVQFWEPAKWMYKMRKVQASLLKRDKRLMMLKMGETDGHFGGGGRLEQLEESAMEIAFLYQALRLPFPPE
ncbi:unnamed protein product [Peronospora effusa]|nr:unnamed protein product [Peronospora effusa]